MHGLKICGFYDWLIQKLPGRLCFLSLVWTACERWESTLKNNKTCQYRDNHGEKFCFLLGLAAATVLRKLWRIYVKFFCVFLLFLQISKSQVSVLELKVWSYLKLRKIYKWHYVWSTFSRRTEQVYGLSERCSLNIWDKTTVSHLFAKNKQDVYHISCL